MVFWSQTVFVPNVFKYHVVNNLTSKFFRTSTKLQSKLRTHLKYLFSHLKTGKDVTEKKVFIFFIASLIYVVILISCCFLKFIDKKLSGIIMINNTKTIGNFHQLRKSIIKQHKNNRSFQPSRKSLKKIKQANKIQTPQKNQAISTVSEFYHVLGHGLMFLRVILFMIITTTSNFYIKLLSLNELFYT